MSAETKRKIEQAGSDLNSADGYLKRAAERAAQGGDKALTEKIQKIQKTTEETAKEVTKRLKEN